MASFPTIGKAPGVYIQEITLPGPIAGVSTSIAAFVGPAESGPLNTPTLLTNFNQFQNIFGSYVENPYRVYAAHAVHGFFAEGGQSCYFVRVGNGAQASLSLLDKSTAPQPTLVVTAQQEGTAGNSTTVKVDASSIANTTVQNPPAATVATTNTAKTWITVTAAGDAAKFKPGDVVLISQGANTDAATISSISGVKVFFQSPLINTYTGGTMRIADLTLGLQNLRVASVTGIEPGSYVTITNTTSTESGVVRVVNPVTNVLTLTSGLTNTYPMGAGANAVTVTTIEFTLTIVSTGSGTETFTNLSLDPRHSHYFANRVNSGSVNVALANPPSTTPPVLNMPVTLAATALSGGASDSLSTITTAQYHAGIDTLRKIDNVNLLCVPDAVPTGGNFPFATPDTHDIQAYMIAHCESMQDRFAILDSAEMLPSTQTFTAVVSQRQGLNSNNGYGALYFPWIIISNPFGSGQIPVPPSGHTAGVYANNDNNFGVFKAPANEPITTALAVEVPMADSDQGPLNDLGINVIRSFTGQGIVIWGARTIAPTDITAWRFVNVRRLLLFIEKSIQEGTRFAVFEPNNLTLWQQLKRLVSDFLTTQWSEGALFGSTPDQAFAVRVDETLNPPAVRALGQLIVQVTIVPTTPAEFIIFQVIQDPTGASLSESTT